MDHLSHIDHMDHLLPDLGLLTSDQCPLGNDGPNDPPAGKTSVQLRETNIYLQMEFLHFPDLDSITLDDLSLGSTVPVMGDPALIIREYLHPGQQHGSQNMQGRDHRLKVVASSIHTRWCWT